MSIGSGVPYNEYTGNGVSTVYAFGFTLLDADDLVVTIDGVATSSYTVSGLGVAAGGSITFSAPPANGAAVLLERVIALVRATQYQTNGDLQAVTVNDDFDRLWLAVQQVDAVEPRALRVPEIGGVPALPSAAARANTTLGFDNDGNPTVLTPTSGSAADVLTRLADTSDAAKGAGAVGSLWTLNYVARTVGNDLRYGSMPSIFKVLTDAQQADVLAYGYSLDLTSTIAAAYTLCKTWYFPAGGYELSGATALTMPGNGSVLTGDGDLTVLNYTGTGTAIDLNGKYYCELSRFKLTTSTGAVGIDMPISSHFWQIDKLHIYGFSTAGVRGTSCYYGTLSRCDIEQCAAGLLGVQDFNGNFINNNSFRGNIRNVHLRDVALNSDGNQIINNEFETSGRAGFLVGIDIEGADGTLIIGNRLECGETGATAFIYVHGGTGDSTGTLIADNYLSGAGTAVPSIKVGAGGAGTKAKNTVIRDNHCFSADASNYAIRIEADADYTMLTTHRRQLGDGVFTVLNSSTSTILTMADDSDFSVGITGLTTTPTVTWRYQVANGIVTLFAQTLNGTSSAGLPGQACTITGLPVLIRPTNPQPVLLRVQDNGVTKLGVGVVDSSGVITLGSDVTGAAFTSGGAKGVIASIITFPLN